MKSVTKSKQTRAKRLKIKRDIVDIAQFLYSSTQPEKNVAFTPGQTIKLN